MPRAIVCAAKGPSVVKPMGAPKPKLHSSGRYDEAGPEIRARHVPAFESGFELDESSFEFLSVAKSIGLSRRPSAYLALPRACREIGVRIGVGDKACTPFDSDLFVDRLPVQA